MRDELNDNNTTESSDNRVVPAQALTSPSPGADQTGIAPVAKPLIVEEVLIEEVSIDGMCGVY